MISVLCVDDEPDLLELARLFLQRSGEFRVVSFISAQEALDSPAITSCEVIVSDYQMPGMDGIAFLKEVRKRFGDIPFILFTGRGREEIVIEAINNGADFYIQKGGDPTSQFAELAHKIRQAVRRHQAEASLRDSERRLSDLIDFLPDAMVAIDSSGRAIAWNRAMEDLTGTAAADILGKGDYGYAVPVYGEQRPLLLDLLSASDEDVRRYYTRIVRNGTTLSAESDLAAPKGNRISLLVKAGPLCNREGRIIGAIEVLRDITEIKKIDLDLRAAYEQVTATEEELRTQYEELKQANEQLFETEEELTCQVDKLAQSEQVLRVNEEHLAMAQAIGRTGSWEYRFETDTIWGSAEALRIFGYPAAARDFPIEDIESCIPERERIHQALLDLITSGKIYDLEYTIRPADGSDPKAIHSVAHLEKDAQGRPVRVIGVIQDITERMTVDTAVRESEKKFAAVFKSSPVALALISASNGVFFDVNDTFLQNTGYTREDVIGKTADALGLFPDAREHGPLDAVLHTGQPVYGMKLHCRGKSRETRICRFTFLPLMMDNKPFRLAITEDVTEQKRAGETLCDGESRFRTLVETLPDMIWEIDTEGVVRYISPMVKTILGYSPEEITGKPLASLVTEPGKTLVEQKIREHPAPGGFAEPFVVPASHRDGHEVVVEIRSVPITDCEGNLTGFRGVARDITWIKRNETALRRANHQLTLLGSITRHDVLNRITVLLGYLTLARKKCSDPGQAGYLKKMESIIGVLKSQVEFTRIYPGLGSQEPQWIELESVMPRDQVPETITLVTEIGGVRVFADALFGKVFANLLDNSIRHGGHVTGIRITCRPEGTGLVIAWEDNGVGIASGKKEQIFRQGVGKNTGLGLFLIREILALTGIAIRETGEPGKGARFEIVVPEGSYLPAHTS